METIEAEATTFTHYLVGRKATSHVVQVYKGAVAASKPSTTDRNLLNFMLKHPHLIGLIDAGLVFHSPNSEARRRLYVLLAILETSTEYGDSFLPKGRNPFYVVVIFYSCFRAITKAGLGLILVKVIA